MERCTNGIFEFSDILLPEQYSKLPTSLHFANPSAEAILLRLLLGKINIADTLYNRKNVNQNYNYTILPLKKVNKFSINSINNILNVDLTNQEISSACDKYFLRNRRNSFVHNKMLFEVSSFLFYQKSSPISAFTHLYRCLEFMSYSFPMMYASISKDYIGSFENLKKYLNGDNQGELGFFRKFIYELFKDDQSVLLFDFNIDLDSPRLDKIQEDFNTIFGDQFAYSLDSTVFSINFKNMMPLFLTLRNRYFHMLVGKGQKNFDSTEYDISDVFRSFNPYFMNWISFIFCKILQFGFESSLAYS